MTGSTVRLYADPATHTGRLIAAAWSLGRPVAGPGWSRLRPWAHMLGFGGHFATKFRPYSTTFGALWAARRTAMRRASASASSVRPELPLPPFAVTVLSRRQPDRSALGPMFSDALGGWRDRGNTSRAFPGGAERLDPRDLARLSQDLRDDLG